MLSYYEFKEAIDARLKRAGLSADSFSVVPGPTSADGYYYEIHGSTYIYAYTERGKRTILCKTQDSEAFYYAVLKDIVKSKAIQYEVAHRVPDQDTRRIWMKKAEVWMEQIDPAFGEKLKNEFAEILEKYPWEDAKPAQNG